MSGDPEQQYFSDGITEDIITERSRFRSLFVVARNSSFQYRDRAIDVRRIGRELGVQYLVEGSVRRISGQVRIAAQLIEAATGSHLWSERYDRVLADVFAMQDEVVRAIVSALPIRLGDATIESARRLPTKNLTAYDYLLRARWAQWHTTGDKQATFEWLEKALVADPACAPAHALLGYSYAYGIFTLGLAMDDATSRALEHTARALAIDDNDAFIHAMAADTFSICGEHELARIHSDRAIELNLNEVWAVSGRGFVITNAGDPAAGLEWLFRAQRLVPHASDDTLFEDLFDCYFNLGEYERAIETFERWRAPPFFMYPLLAAAYALLGCSTEAQSAVTEYQRRRPPGYSTDNFVAATLRVKKRQIDQDRLIEGYRKAGLSV
jgi:TolB-like protein/Tfp pilus assembly protein PilF